MFNGGVDLMFNGGFQFYWNCFHNLIVIMAGKTTRNYYQQMLDFIKEEGFCILPSNLIESLLKEDTKDFELIHTLQENLLKPLII